MAAIRSVARSTFGPSGVRVEVSRPDEALRLDGDVGISPYCYDQ